MLNHVMVGSNDIERSKRFYDAVLATLTVQPHPEFDVAFAQVCCDLRDGKAPDAVVATARASLAEPMDSAKLGGAITRFLARRVAP